MQQPNRQGGAMPMPEVAPAVKGRSAMTGGRAFGNRSAFGVAQQRPVASAVPATKPTAPANMRPRTQPAFNDAQLQQLQQEKVLREQQNQRYLSNPAAMAQLAQAPNNLQNLAAQKTPSLAMPVQGRSSMDAQSMRAMEAAPRAPQKTFSQPVSSSPASMTPPKEAAPRAAQVPVPQTQPRTTPPAMTPPAMRKGGAVKKKPGYAKGGMVMANCGASMKPQQKAKK